MRPSQSTFTVFCFFLVFFALLFLQFPLAGSLPGYIDVIAYLGLFNDYGNHVEAWFTGEQIGHCLYPAGPPYAYLEPSYASSVFFLFFKLLRFNDLWAYYGFYVSIFTLNATCAFVLARQYLSHSLPAVFVALAFAASSFAFGNFENQNTLVYFPALLSIYHFRAFLLNGNSRNLIWAMLAGGAQIYFGTYTFIFQSIVLLVLGLVHYRFIFFANGWWAILKTFPIYLLLSVPYIVVYLFNPELADFYSPSRNDTSTISAVSLNLNDLYRALPNNLLYPVQTDLPQVFIYNLRSAFMGITFYVLVLIGFFARPVFRKEVTIIAIVTLLIALGPFISLGEHSIPLPIGWINEVTDLDAFVRHFARMFFFTSLMLALFAGYGIWFIANRTRVPLMLVLVLASTLFIIENTPFPFEKFNSTEFLVEGRLYEEIGEREEPAVVVHLPSTLDFASFDLGKPFNQFAREYTYMYWQSKHRQHCLNGATSFFPPERLRNAELTALLPDSNAMDELIRLNNIDYVVYHPQFELPHEASSVAMLQNHSKLSLLKTTSKYLIFKVK